MRCLLLCPTLPALTSADGHPLLQDTDVELQSELGRRSKECLDDRSAGEGCSVCEQLSLRLPHLPLHLLRLTPAGHLLLPGDADIRLLHTTHAAIDTKRLETPMAQEQQETTRKLQTLENGAGFKWH